MASPAACPSSASRFGRQPGWLACIGLLGGAARLAQAQETAASGCTESRDCAERLGYGKVCDGGKCASCVDRTEITDLVVAKAGMHVGDPADTTISNASLLVLLTTNMQLVIQVGTTGRGYVGGAVFVNAETFSRPAFSFDTVSQPATNLFQYVRPAAGFGARILMSKESRTNLRLDFAWGVDSFAIHLGAGEVF